ncbi:MAG: hypothetical protein V2J51_14750 [Erythrobacter sp.]|jgi:hypothetical protein|nr:hypothetical protein [Erythrobacter sp.]
MNRESDGRLGAAIGGDMVGQGWRTLFWVAAGFNFIIGLAGMLSPQTTLDARIVGLLVFGFGITYALVARDPLRFGPVLWAGVIGKLGVVALLSPEALESGNILILAVLALDAGFAIGFLAFLLTRGDPPN